MNDANTIPALSLKGLVKKFRDFTLGPLDFDLQPGRVVGLIGPNGAGKTTTMNTIVGLLKHEKGAIEIYGRPTDPNKIDWKYDIGFVGDEHVFYEYWSGERNLRFLSDFYPAWSWDKAYGLAKRFDLDLKKMAKKLSKGNRAKLALIGALAYSPRLLLLDEPSSGLDPIVRSEFLDVLWEVNESGETAILYSTHILSDIGRLADELVFLIDGQITLREQKDVLLDSWRQISFTCDDEISSIAGVVNIKRKDSSYIVISSEYKSTEEALKGIHCRDVDVLPMSVDDVVVQIMKMKGKTS